MCQPYTYRIKFLPTDQEYYGVRHGKKANPENFWKTYFTSSQIVKELIKEHGKDAFVVVGIKLHASREDALWYEEVFLVSMNAAKSTHWLNRSNGRKRLCVTEESAKKTAKSLQKFWENNHSARKAVSERLKAYYEANPEARAEMSARSREFAANNPEFFKENAERVRQYYVDHPEARVAAREKTKEQFSSEESRKAQGERRKEFNKNNPDVVEAMRERVKQQWADPEARKQMSEIKKQNYIDDPELNHRAGNGARAYFEDPANRAAQAERARAQGKTEAGIEKARAMSRKHWADPESRVRASDIQRKRWNDPIARVRQSLALSTARAKKANRPFSYIPESHPSHRN
jgi:hypothetical protein